MKEGTRVLIALGAAVAGGTAIAVSGNASLLGAADALMPVGTLWVNAIRMTVIPLVVALLITGIASAADVKAVGRIGGRTLLVFGVLLAGCALVVMPFAPSLFALLPRDPAMRPPLPPGAAWLVWRLLYPVVAMVGRVPMKQFAAAVLPAQLIAASSSSSMASLPALVQAAERLRLTERVTGFVLPLAVSAFKLAAPVSWTIGALFVAWFYGITLHVRELVTIAAAAVFLAFMGPGVPRGAFLMLAPLFVAIGLPVEGIGILIAVDAIPDVFSTVLNVTGDLAAAV